MIKVVCASCLAVAELGSASPDEEHPCSGCGSELLPARPAALEGDAIQAVIGGSSLPVVLDFWSTGCGPCLLMTPMFEMAAKSFLGRVVFAKVDSRKNQETAEGLGVRSIPTLILFRDGQEIARHSGFMDRNAISEWVEQRLAE